MGKDSKHQRTKGGVQPSSSSRTAELLEKTGSGAGALSFLAAAAEAQLEFGVQPTTAALSSMLIEDDLPPDARLVFRKLQKKDAVTKIKALSELYQMLGGTLQTQESSPCASRDVSSEMSFQGTVDVEDLSKTLLPHYIKSYQKLCLDDSRKVREQSQVTLCQVCQNVGRSLAPHLKQLMPYWFLSQHDLYSPVASAARKAFKTTFPTETKQTEAIKFCQADILRTSLDLLQGLLGNTVKAGSAPKEKKKQAKKKGDTSSSDNATLEVPSETQNALDSQSSSSDGESHSTRTAYGIFSSFRTLLSLKLINVDTINEIFGSHGLFWSASESIKSILVRRAMFDLLAQLSDYLSNPDHGNFKIPSDKCTKFINVALGENRRETLPNLWNAFLLLNLHGVLNDVHVARKQLLTCCKNGFYGNASQISSGVLPLVSMIWDGLVEQTEKEEFSHDIIHSTISGYRQEKSPHEKTAITRTLGEIVGFLCKHRFVNIEPVYSFVFNNISDLSVDFPKVFGSLIKEIGYYTNLLKYGRDNELLNSKHFGHFVVAVCSSDFYEVSSQASGVVPKRKVQFKEPGNQGDSNSRPGKQFEQLTELKRLFLQNAVRIFVETKAFKALSIVSRNFQSLELWENVSIIDVDFSVEEDVITRLQLTLDLIKAYPETPSTLLKLSEEFENFKDPSDLRLFLREVEGFSNIQPIKRWLRTSVFTEVIEGLLRNGDLSEAALQSILKFVMRDIFPNEFKTVVVQLVLDRCDNDLQFFGHVSHILATQDFDTDLSKLYLFYWDLYFLKSVTQAPDVEVIEKVCFENRNKLDPIMIISILEKYLDSCEKVKQIDILIDISKRLEYTCDVIRPQNLLKIKKDMLIHLGYSYAEVSQDILDTVPKFSKIHCSYITKAIYRAKMVETSEVHSDLIGPLLSVLYSQSIVKIWKEVEKSDYFEKMNQELSLELDELSSRLVEKIFLDKNSWNMLWQEINKLSESENIELDPIWQSRMPLRVLIEYCTKSELQTDYKKTKSSNNEFDDQIKNILQDFSQNLFKVNELIPWITEKRTVSPEVFEFEVLYRHQKNKKLVNQLLVITNGILDNLQKDELTEEFVSLAACWIAAWLKQSKNLNISSKYQLLWTSNLCRGVAMLGRAARNMDSICPKFVQEYVEFHSSQIYPVVYSHFLQLNENVGDHNFWTMQTLYYVSTALVTMPANILAFIEPDCIKVCDNFTGIATEGVSLCGRIAAYKVLRKISYDKSGQEDLPIIPPSVDTMIKSLLQKLRLTEDDMKARELIVSYLLIWDALLVMQKGSNEFAAYVRDQEHLLIPFLNTLFFSEVISLNNSSQKYFQYFEKDVDLTPGVPVHLSHLACTVIQRTLRHLPYTVRWWWNNQITRQRDRVFVEKFIVKYLSSKLASEELGGVKLREGIDDNVTVHCHSGCNELIAHYRIEETNVTLTVSLPLNHPLGPVTVKISDKKLHGKISNLLNSRSHSLSAGLKLWKENLDGMYKDVDECMICFCILQGNPKQIPKLSCKTCHKKFHAACLYKWFSTSNKSECPLCRNLF